jgi:hypothetical protein
VRRETTTDRPADGTPSAEQRRRALLDGIRECAERAMEIPGTLRGGVVAELEQVANDVETEVID